MSQSATTPVANQPLTQQAVVSGKDDKSGSSSVSKSAEPAEIVIDTAATQKQQHQQGVASWGPMAAPMAPMAPMGGVIFASMGPMGGFSTDTTWMPPTTTSQGEFKKGTTDAPQRPGSRRYNDAYGAPDDQSGGGDDEENGGASGEEDEDDATVSFHKHPQRAAMATAYGKVKEQSLRDMNELYDQLTNAQDIRDLDTEVLRSILLSGRRQYNTELYEEVIHGLLVVVESTLDRLNDEEKSTDPHHQHVGANAGANAGVHPSRRPPTQQPQQQPPPPQQNQQQQQQQHPQQYQQPPQQAAGRNAPPMPQPTVAAPAHQRSNGSGPYAQPPQHNHQHPQRPLSRR